MEDKEHYFRVKGKRGRGREFICRVEKAKKGETQKRGRKQKKKKKGRRERKNCIYSFLLAYSRILVFFFLLSFLFHCLLCIGNLFSCIIMMPGHRQTKKRKQMLGAVQSAYNIFYLPFPFSFFFLFTSAHLLFPLPCQSADIVVTRLFSSSLSNRWQVQLILRVARLVVRITTAFAPEVNKTDLASQLANKDEDSQPIKTRKKHLIQLVANKTSV